MEIISRRQLIILGAAITINATLINVPAQITTVAKADFWMAYLLAAAFLVIPLWMLAKLSARFPQMDIYDILIHRLPIVGRLLSMLYVGFFLFVLARDLRSIVDFVNVALLPLTPLVVLAAFVAFTIALMSRGGIEIIARLNTLWQPILMIAISLFPLVLLREFDRRHLWPAFEYGFIPSMQGAWYAVPYIGEIVILPFIFANRTFPFKPGFIGMLSGVFLLEVLNWTVVMALGLHIPGRVLYPNYEMVRQIRLTDFLDRFDLPIVGVWLPAMIIKTSISLFAVCHGIKRIFPIVSAKEIAIPFGLLALSCSFWLFRNAINLFVFNGVWPAIALVFEWLLPVLLFLLVWPKRVQ